MIHRRQTEDVTSAKGGAWQAGQGSENVRDLGTTPRGSFENGSHGRGGV